MRPVARRVDFDRIEALRVALKLAAGSCNHRSMLFSKAPAQAANLALIRFEMLAHDSSLPSRVPYVCRYERQDSYRASRGFVRSARALHRPYPWQTAFAWLNV